MIELKSDWGDSYPPNMTDSWARELGIEDELQDDNPNENEDN